MYESASQWPAVLAWVRPELQGERGGTDDSSEQEPWEGRVVAIRREVGAVRSALDHLGDDVSHLHRAMDVQSQMITSLRQQVGGMEQSQAHLTALIEQMLREQAAPP